MSDNSEKPREPEASATLAARIGRLVKSLLVGGVATIADWLTLILLVEAAALPAEVANAPSLAVGALIQFLGCRHVVFAAARGSMRHQLVGFTIVELLTLALNGLAFQVLVSFTPIAYWLARPMGTFGVFVFFSYPMWNWVFAGSMRAKKRQT